MSKIIPEGFYEGKLFDYGIRMTKSTNQPSVTAIFKIMHEGAEHNVYWQGTFKGRDGKSNETTLKALIVMGIDNMNRISDIAVQKAGGALDTNKTYNLKVQVEYDDKQGKSFNKVAFINEQGAGSLKDLVQPNDFLPMVAGLGIAGDLNRLLFERNAGNPVQSNQKTSLDDINF